MNAAYAALVAAALVACGSGPVAQPAPSPTPRGPLMGGNGYVIREPGKPDRFCERRYETGIGNPPPPECLHGMDVYGADFEALEREYTYDGVRWRIGWLEGHVVDGAFHATHSGPWRHPPQPRFVIPDACEEPPGGWPVQRLGPAHEELWTGEPTYPRLDVQPAHEWAFHDSGGQWGARIGVDPDDPRRAIVVIPAYDAVAAEKALRPVYGATLCVVPLRYTRAEVAAALKAARAFSDFPHIVDDDVDDRMQVTLEVDPETVGDEERAFAASQPEGLIVFGPWLAPVPERPNAAVAGVRVLDPTKLTVLFRHDGCADPRAVTAEETPGEVRLAATVTPKLVAPDGCERSVRLAYALVKLSAPLGDRAVVDAADGRRVAVER